MSFFLVSRDASVDVFDDITKSGWELIFGLTDINVQIFGVENLVKHKITLDVIWLINVLKGSLQCHEATLYTV